MILLLLMLLMSCSPIETQEESMITRSIDTTSNIALDVKVDTTTINDTIYIIWNL